MNHAWLAAGVAAVLAVAVALHRLGDAALYPIFLIALLLGIVFVVTDFGFAGGFRDLLLAGDTRAISASLLIPAVAALVVIPVATLGGTHGRFVAGIGPMLLIGAALFGIGMQLANGCGSGSLVAAGAGSRRMWLALPFFCLGSLLGSLALPVAMLLPEAPGVDLPLRLGTWGGLAATLGLIALVALGLWRWGGAPAFSQLRAAALIGTLAAAMFLAVGEPWGITMGLTVTGAKGAMAVGLDPSDMAFWSWTGPKAMLANPLLSMPSALGDLGLLLGAMLAAGATGRFRGATRLALRPAIAAALGGLAMGVGARLSSGCNIGAFVGGISSGSLHGFVWMVAVLPGCWLGIRLRPWFGMTMR